MEIAIPEADILLKFSFVVTAIVTIVGWFVVASMTDRREFRKEVREYVKDAKATCEAVQASAHDYWLICDKKSAGASAVVLKAEVGNLARHLQILATLGVATPSEMMADVRRAATGGEFEKKGRVRTPVDQDRMAELAGSIQDLISSIDMAFYQRFKPRTQRQWSRFIPIVGLLFISRDA